MKPLFGILCGAVLVVTASSASCDLPTVSVTFGSCNISGSGQDDTAYSHGVLLTVNQDQICASPSTFVATPLLEHQDVCGSDEERQGMTTGQCRSRRGNYVTSGSVDIVSADGLSQLNPNMLKFLPKINKATQAPIELQLGTTVDVRSALIDSGIEHGNSHLPLNEKSELLAKMKSTGQIVSNSFGLDVGSQNYYSPRNGRLTFGGYQPAMINGPRWEFKIDRNNLNIKNRSCPLQVDIRKIMIQIDGKKVDLVGADSNTGVCIEIYDRLTRLPSSGLEALKLALRSSGFNEVAQAKDKPKGVFAGLLDTEPGLLYDTNGTKTNLSGLVDYMQITIDKGLVGGNVKDLEVILRREDLVQPLIGLDSAGVPQVNKTFEKLMVYHEKGIGDAAVLGRAFLEKLYLFVDYDKDVFYLGHLDQEGRYQPAVSPGTCNAGEKPANYFGWLVALTVLLGVAILVIGVLAWLMRRALGGQKAQMQIVRTDIEEVRDQLLERENVREGSGEGRYERPSMNDPATATVG